MPFGLSEVEPRRMERFCLRKARFSQLRPLSQRHIQRQHDGKPQRKRERAQIGVLAG